MLVVNIIFCFFFRHLGNDVCVVIFIDIPEEEEKKEWEVRDKQKAKKEEGKEKPEEIEIGKKEIEKETDEKEAEKETEKETEEEKEKKDTEENEKETDEKEKTEEEKIEDLLKRGLFHPSSISSHFNHVFLVVSVNHRATRETFAFFSLLFFWGIGSALISKLYLNSIMQGNNTLQYHNRQQSWGTSFRTFYSWRANGTK